MPPKSNNIGGFMLCVHFQVSNNKNLRGFNLAYSITECMIFERRIFGFCIRKNTVRIVERIYLWDLLPISNSNGLNLGWYGQIRSWTQSIRMEGLRE